MSNSWATREGSNNLYSIRELVDLGQINGQLIGTGLDFG